MFGIFNKSINTQEALLLSIRTALICYVEEKENGGRVTTTSEIDAHVTALAKQPLKKSDVDLISFWAGRFLYEKFFIKDLAARALQGPLGTFSKSDESKIEKIIPEAFN